jgi:hypothetical protein
MEQTAPSPQFAKLMLFLLLTSLMVLAGTHLLESVYYCAWGFAHSGLAGGNETATWFQVDALGPLGLVYLAYRYMIALGALFLSYHCLALREWARSYLVWLLFVDLFAWLGSSFAFLLQAEGFQLSLDEIVLQVTVVGIEGLLFWLLTHPAGAGHFRAAEKKSSIEI